MSTILIENRRDFVGLDPSSSPLEFSALTDLPVFLGYIFGFLLDGILVVQIFVYYICFPNDPRYMKMTVGFVFLLESLFSIFATFGLISSMIVFGDLFDSASFQTFRGLGPLSGLAILTVHAFYSLKIHEFNGHWSLVLLIILLSIVQCVSITFTATQSSLSLGVDVHEEGIIALTLWLLSNALCDIIITVSLLLLTPRTFPQKGRTNSIFLVQKIMRIATETGLIPMFWILIEILFFFMFRNSLIHYILYYTVPKMYSNCMMATLNARLTGGDWEQEDVSDTENPIAPGDTKEA